MGRIYRVTSLAAAAVLLLVGAANGSPSFAETITTTDIMVTNEQLITPVPEFPQAIVEESIESAPNVAPAPIARPKAKSLAQLVAQQSHLETLDREAECLAASVYFESKGEPLEGQLAVAEVVINRANSGGRFPPSICSVVFQKGQFSFVRGKAFPPILRAGKQWREAVAIAQIAMNQQWDSRASKAMFFHATRVSPRWNKVRVAQLGNHVFYR